MIIRKAKPEDAEEILKFRLETIEKINSKDYTKEEIEGFKKIYSKDLIIKKINETEMFCLINKNEIIGTIYLQNNKIGGFFIKVNYIGKGFGLKLLNFIENYAKKKGLNDIKLFSTRTAYNFYINRGYKSSLILNEDYPINIYFDKKLGKILK